MTMPRPPTTATTKVAETIDWVKTWEQGSLGCLGRFQLRERLGDGGFGQVFRAYDPRLDRDVALKLLKQTDPNERVMERFFREARAVARLDHPNIVAVHDAGFDEGKCWVAYQLIAGRPLWWYRDHHRLDATTIARIVNALADALDHSHQLGVVHRDIKPSNVLVDNQGRPRLIDFGLAQRSDVGSDLTREGAVIGTPAYMSPEQALGHNQEVDERSDVYSLGVVFHELLYGHRPDEDIALPNIDQTETTRKFQTESGARPSRPIDPGIPDALKKICSRAAAADPDARHATARALADDLEDWLQQQQSNWHRPDWSEPRPVVVWAAVLVILVTLVTTQLTGKSRPGPLNVDRAQFAVMNVPNTTASAPSPPRETVSFVGNRDTLVYHTRTCPAALAIKPANQIKLESTDEAAKGKFRPCHHCSPNLSARGPFQPPAPPAEGP